MTEERDSAGRGEWQLGDVLQRDLTALEHAGLRRGLRSINRRDGALVQCDGRTLVDFASNDYLGLASDTRLRDAMRASLASHGTGSAAARLVSGNSVLHEQLEAELARFKQAESALLFSSGYAANTGAIQALVGRRDVVYADELNHASLIDACRLSRAEVRVLPHCDPDALDAALTRDAGAFRRRLVAVDSVFSMDGDLYPLPDLVRVARAHKAWTYVDDAHGTGVLGANGRGAAEEWGVEGELDVVMGTLGKALGVSGAFIAGSRVLTEFLLNRARTFIYTTATPAPLAAALLSALEIVRSEPWRRARVRELSRRVRSALTAHGWTVPGAADGHIVPILLGDSARAMRAGSALLDAGFLVGAIRPPTVPMGGARLRLTLSAAHSDEQVESLLVAMRGVHVEQLSTTGTRA